MVLSGSRNQTLTPDADGVYRSQQLPGLWLAGDRLRAGDLAAVLSVLQQGVSTPEHRAFVEPLNG
ncbi:hypothetical protein [Trichothermofontia sp.]